MKEKLRHIVQQLALKGFRRAGGPEWGSAMALMENLIREHYPTPKIQSWKDEKGIEYRNYSMLFKGESSKKIIIAAHYDSFEETPGADDNASAIAVLLCLSELLCAETQLPCDIELVCYACEEPPFFGTEEMGSFHHARHCTEDNTAFMICLEMVGYFSEQPDSQEYPLSFLKYLYGRRGNYLMLVSNYSSQKALKQIWKSVKNNPALNYKRFISPFNSFGMDWSDHRNYWAKGIPAVMITDTSLFRNKNYHQLTDTANTLDYGRMALLVQDLYCISTKKKLK
jgi:Zn-dependent M28 family amino/carboxypeptidase